MVSGDRRYWVIGYLRRLIAQQTALDDIRLRFWESPLTGYCAHGSKKIAPRTIKKEVCRLLNSITPGGRALTLVGDRALISDSEDGARWQVVRQISAAKGFRQKVRKSASTLKGRLRPTEIDLVLRTTCETDGIMSRDSYTIEEPRSVDVTHPASVGEWAVVVLNANTVHRFRLTPSLRASDWAHVLPLLTLPRLEELTAGRGTVYSDLDLCDVSSADLDAFLIRHTEITRLEYCPELSPTALRISAFSLASFPYLTHLTTTPVHFLHLHHVPNTFPELAELVLFTPFSTPASLSEKEDFMAVLQLLNRTDPQALRLRFSGTWISPLTLDGLGIKCIESMRLFGEFELDVASVAEFLACSQVDEDIWSTETRLLLNAAIYPQALRTLRI
ncbi:hypothetical protein DFH07DRAFT_1057664 [Mycena maculata]|uniref:Uncharacterized protein n=1 Tax=Mycena maculata TaxID=230809 RepID=A0AAD7JT54_9AGAR|nr:hypothetical protein DFH07DRAFT_1057664 [Mycena maculata]